MGLTTRSIVVSSFVALATLTQCGYSNEATVGIIGNGPEKGDDNAASSTFPIREPELLRTLAFDEILRVRRTSKKLADGDKVGRDGCINYRAHRVGKTTLKAEYKCAWLDGTMSSAAGKKMAFAVSGTEVISETRTTGEKPVRESSGTLKLVAAWQTNLDKRLLSTNLRRKVELETGANFAEMETLAAGTFPFSSEVEEGAEASTKLEWWKMEGGGEITLDSSLEAKLAKGSNVTLAYRPGGNSAKPQTLQFVLTAETEVEFANQPDVPCARPVGKFTWTQTAEAGDTDVTLTTDENGITDGAGKKTPWPSSCLETGS